jgi:hypothetical protein
MHLFVVRRARQRPSFARLYPELVPDVWMCAGRAAALWPPRVRQPTSGFTAMSVDVVDLATTASAGTFTFTAANGDQLFTTTTGGEDEFTPPNVSHSTLVATIVGGPARLAAATGTFTIQQTSIIDCAAGTSSGSASFKGTISRGK